jgi:hypothetical protein
MSRDRRPVIRPPTESPTAIQTVMEVVALCGLAWIVLIALWVL